MAEDWVENVHEQFIEPSFLSKGAEPIVVRKPIVSGSASPRVGRGIAEPVAGPAARRIESEADVENVIALMRISYEEARARGIS